MKRFTALIIAVLLLCPIILGSCSKAEEVPDGMKLASLEGEPFKLYVPEAMTLNLESGISSAFSYIPEKFMISARYYTPSNAEMTLDEYMQYCADSYAESLESFNMTSLEATVLSGVDGKRMSYTTKFDSVNYSCEQFTVLYNGDMVSLNFYIPSHAAEKYAESVNEIAGVFELCEKPETINDEVVDKKTPDGMKIASSDVVEYRLYVPKTWICSSESGKSEAYYPESQKTNVTVTSYIPEESVDVEGFSAICDESYNKSINGYDLISKETITVANKNAIAFTFTANYGGATYKIKQVLLIYNEMAYLITYTATEENFDLHIDDFDKIISEFKFR